MLSGRLDDYFLRKLSLLEPAKPRRLLGVFDATMIVMGGIVGSGIFINPYVVALRVHTPFLILGVWLLGGGLALLGALSGRSWRPACRARADNIFIYARPITPPWLSSTDGSCCW